MNQPIIFLTLLCTVSPLFSAAQKPNTSSGGVIFVDEINNNRIMQRPHHPTSDLDVSWPIIPPLFLHCTDNLTPCYPSALYKATCDNKLNKVSLLINKGENVNIQNDSGITPLMVAANGTNVAIVRLLLTAGANVQLQDYKKRTALDSTLHNYLLDISIKKNIGVPVNHADLFNTIALLITVGAQPTQAFSELCTVSLKYVLTTSWPYVPAKTKLLIASLYKLNLEEYVTKEEIETGYKQAWQYLTTKIKSELLAEYDVGTDDLPADHITLSIPMPNHVKQEKEKEWNLKNLTALNGLTPPQRKASRLPLCDSTSDE